MAVLGNACVAAYTDDWEFCFSAHRIGKYTESALNNSNKILYIIEDVHFTNVTNHINLLHDNGTYCCQTLYNFICSQQITKYLECINHFFSMLTINPKYGEPICTYLWFLGKNIACRFAVTLRTRSGSVKYFIRVPSADPKRDFEVRGNV